MRHAERVKCYGIFPVFDLEKNDQRSRECLDIITTMVVEALREGGDHFHYAVDWLNPGDDPDIGIFCEDIAEPQIRQFSDVDALRNRIAKSVDPFCGIGSTVRSIATCRAVTFGYDGQAFLCLRLEDEPPVTPDRSMVIVEEQPNFLIGTDWFDGWLPGDAQAQNGS